MTVGWLPQLWVSNTWSGTGIECRRDAVAAGQRPGGAAIHGRGRNTLELPADAADRPGPAGGQFQRILLAAAPHVTEEGGAGSGQAVVLIAERDGRAQGAADIKVPPTLVMTPALITVPPSFGVKKMRAEPVIVPKLVSLLMPT